MTEIDKDADSWYRIRILELVKKNLNRFGLDSEDVDRSWCTFYDIGMDSLDMIEMVMDIEDELDINIPDNVGYDVNNTMVDRFVDWVVEQGR